MPDVLHLQRDSPAEAVVRAGAELRQGRLVAVPTDTLYVILADGLQPGAVAELARLTEGDVAIALAKPLEVSDWLPYLRGVGLRLSRNCWPGPLALCSDAGLAAGLASRLPDGVRSLLLRDGLLALRCSGHSLLSQIITRLAGPVVLGELPNAVRPEEVAATAPMSLIIDDGPTQYAKPASVVHVQGQSWKLLRDGVLGPEHLSELALCRVLFVCTGNTCRSPLAMALCRKLLAEHFGCPPAELADRGFQVISAGMAAIIGEEASPEAVEVAEALGAELAEHRSQPLTAELLAQADCLFTMTQSHLRMLQSLNLDFGPAPRMLAPSGRDVVDPIGSDVEVYEECARTIAEHLRQRLAEILEM